MSEPISVEATVNVPVEAAWEAWNNPEDIMNWAHAGDEWHAPSAENDLRVGGRFKTRMEAKDGSAGFDFEGTYTNVDQFKLIEYEMDDGRKVRVEFIERGNATIVRETFDPENENPIDMQRDGWQAILDNFKKHAESLG